MQDWRDLPNYYMVDKYFKKGKHRLKGTILSLNPEEAQRWVQSKHIHLLSQEEKTYFLRNIDSLLPKIIKRDGQIYRVLPEINEWCDMEEWRKSPDPRFTFYVTQAYLAIVKDKIKRTYILLADRIIVGFIEEEVRQYEPALIRKLSDLEKEAHHLTDDNLDKMMRELHNEKGGKAVDEGRVKLYKDGDRMAIMTDISDEADFIDKVSTALNELIGNGAYSGDWHFQLVGWLPCIVEICASIRGYKANVRKVTETYAGWTNSIDDPPVIAVDGKGRIVGSEMET